MSAIKPLESFDIPSLEARVSDFRVAPAEDKGASLWIFWEGLQGKILNKERFGVSLCASDDSPGHDPELQSMSFVVYQKTEGDLVVSGFFNLYNINQELATKDLIEVSAMIAPWMGRMNGLNIGDTLAGLMKHLLETNLPIVGGSQTLDIVQWDFPSVKGQRWSQSINCETAIQGVIDGGNPLRSGLDGSEPTGGYPKDIRRSGKPRPTVLDDEADEVGGLN